MVIYFSFICVMKVHFCLFRRWDLFKKCKPITAYGSGRPNALTLLQQYPLQKHIRYRKINYQPGNIYQRGYKWCRTYCRIGT